MYLDEITIKIRIVINEIILINVVKSFMITKSQKSNHEPVIFASKNIVNNSTQTMQTIVMFNRLIL
jgi:hypothetical protein